MAPFDFKEGAHPVTGEPLVDRDPGDENDYTIPPQAPLDEGRAKLENLKTAATSLLTELAYFEEAWPLGIQVTTNELSDALDAFDD